MDRRSVLAAAVAFGLIGCGAERADERFAPLAATLRDLDGGTASLAEWHGRVLVLNVWASWCAPCRSEMASLQALSERIEPSRAAVIGLAVDEDVNLVREYLRRAEVRFRNFVTGAERPARDWFGVRAVPETLILAPDGMLRTRIRGARDWTDVSLLSQLGIPLRAAHAAAAGSN